MSEVRFQLPDGFTVREGVCVVSGWEKDGSPGLRCIPFKDEMGEYTQHWTRIGLMRAALAKTEADLARAWR